MHFVSLLGSARSIFLEVVSPILPSKLNGVRLRFPMGFHGGSTAVPSEDQQEDPAELMDSQKNSVRILGQILVALYRRDLACFGQPVGPGSGGVFDQAEPDAEAHVESVLVVARKWETCTMTGSSNPF
jgi:hypothetical protein